MPNFFTSPVLGLKKQLTRLGRAPHGRSADFENIPRKRRLFLLAKVL